MYGAEKQVYAAAFALALDRGLGVRQAAIQGMGAVMALREAQLAATWEGIDIDQLTKARAAMFANDMRHP